VIVKRQQQVVKNSQWHSTTRTIWRENHLHYECMHKGEF